MTAPAILRLTVERFRGIESLLWLPGAGVNVILGGGDVGKTAILEAIGLLLSPYNPTNIPDTDYYGRNVDAGFVIEAVLSLPAETGISDQVSPSWPWHWNGKEAVVPSTDGGASGSSEPVYRVQARSANHELAHEILQPDGNTAIFSISLRRSIGLVRLSGDERNDRDLRLVQGSALDRLLSDKSFRSRMTSELSDAGVKDQLADTAKENLAALDLQFKARSLPDDLDLAVTGGQGFSIAALIGLTANRNGIRLPLASWGAGTRRIATLAIAEQKQGEAPITLVDELERGLEPYRQRSMMAKLQSGRSQVFLTTHSPSIISAASTASLWYVDHQARIGALDSAKVKLVRNRDPETFLARLTIVSEGATELGFVSALLERGLATSLEQHGIHITDGGGHEATLDLLEALSQGGLHFGGFADNEDGKHPTRWAAVSQRLDSLLFRWVSGCLEENILQLVPDSKLLDLLTDVPNGKTGLRLRALAERIGTPTKDFDTIQAAAGSNLKAHILGACLGEVPEGRAEDKKLFESHAQNFFKSVPGGRELAVKVFSLSLWPALKPQLMPFVSAVRAAVGLSAISDIPP